MTVLIILTDIEVVSITNILGAELVGTRLAMISVGPLISIYITVLGWEQMVLELIPGTMANR